MSTREPAHDAPAFMREYENVPRGPLELRCYTAEVKIRGAREALERGDVATAAVMLGAILPAGVR